MAQVSKLHNKIVMAFPLVKIQCVCSIYDFRKEKII